MDKGKEVESDSFTDGDASKSEFVENLEKEEEKNLEGEAEEVEIPGHEDSACLLQNSWSLLQKPFV